MSSLEFITTEVDLDVFENTSQKEEIQTKIPEKVLKKQVQCTLDLVTLSVSAKTVTKSVPNLKIKAKSEKPKSNIVHLNLDNTPLNLDNLISDRKDIKKEVQQLEPELILKEECWDVFENSQNPRKIEIQTQLVSFNGRKKPHACTKCEFSFTEKQSLEIHMVTAHGGNKPYECSKCHSQFLLKSELRSHVSLIHNGEKPIKCPICDETFVDKKNCQSHIKNVHDGKMPFKCSLCECRCQTKKELNQHQCPFKNKTIVETKVLTCFQCSLTFTEREELAQHFQEAHKDKKKYPCSFTLCEASFDNTALLGRHYSTDHKGNSPYVCLICQKEFKEKTYMKRHILRFHPIKKEQDQMIPGIIQEKKKSLTCSFCFERFENNANLTEHIAATHCKTFTKRTLPKTFPQKSTILDAEKSEKPKSKIVHLPLNLNLPLNLENLPSNLNLPLNLDNLPLNLDSITSDRKDVDYYRCSTCPRRFLIESDLEKHKIEHDQKSHFCPYCGNCYAHKCHLTQHVNTKHEPYECLQCFRRFTEKVNLTEHINSVHKIKKEQKNVPNPIVEIQPSDIKKEKQDQDIKSKIVHLPLNLDNLPLNLDNDRKYVKTKMPEQGLKKQVTCTLDLVTLSVSAKTVITKSLPNLKIRKAEPKVENIETEVQQFEPEVIIKEESEDFLQE